VEQFSSEGVIYTEGVQDAIVHCAIRGITYGVRLSSIGDQYRDPDTRADLLKPVYHNAIPLKENTVCLHKVHDCSCGAAGQAFEVDITAGVGAQRYLI